MRSHLSVSTGEATLIVALIHCSVGGDLVATENRPARILPVHMHRRNILLNLAAAVIQLKFAALGEMLHVMDDTGSYFGIMLAFTSKVDPDRGFRRI